MKKNTILCVDLKTIMQDDALPCQGRTYRGVLTRDAEHHYLFEEEAHASGRIHRLNPKLYVGRHLSLVRRQDGRYQLHCRAFKADTLGNRNELASKIFSELVEALQIIE